MLALLYGCDQGEGKGDSPFVPPPHLEEDPVEGLVLARRIRVQGELEGPIDVVCEADLPGERHVLRADPDRDELVFYGLLAETAYACHGGGSEPVSFVTDPLPDTLPSPSLTVRDPARGPRGYLLMNHGTDFSDDRQTKVLVYDDEGRLRWYWFPEGRAPDFDAQYLGDGVFVGGGGYGIVPTRFELSGAVVAQAPGPFEGPDQLYNHHVEQLPDGSVLTTETDPTGDPDDPDHTWRGFVIERLSHDLERRIWRLPSQDWVDQGHLLPPSADRYDAYHLNALQPLPAGTPFGPDVMLASLYALRRVVIFDPATGEYLDGIGVGTDWTLEDADGTPLPTSEWFWGQHAPELEGDLLLMHDNGAARPGVSPFSRALELRLDPVRKVATKVWEWREEGWHEPIWGDVDRLPGGLVSITHAHCDKCAILPGQRTEILVVDRADDAVVWRLRFPDPHDATYRSEWIDGCTLFARDC